MSRTERQCRSAKDDRISSVQTIRFSTFTYCGVDMFGPSLIKQRGNEVKRNGETFRCMGSRGVHIEIIHSLDTDSFVQALRRVIGRRGNIKHVTNIKVEREIYVLVMLCYCAKLTCVEISGQWPR